MPIIAVNLRHLIEARGVAVAKLARAAGVDRGTIARLMEGDTGEVPEPLLGTIEAVAYALGVRVTDLLDGESSPPVIPPRSS